jgi:hydrogenase maturation protease
MTTPLLVFGWGNASRGDDALGPLFIERLRDALASTADVECLDDYQLQVEHALDLAGRERVLFVDASLSCRAPFEVTALRAAQDASFTTHAMSPQAVMQVYRDLHGEEPPPCTLLAIRGERFELGEPPGAQALAHLDAALGWAGDWLGVPFTSPDRRSATAEAALRSRLRPTAGRGDELFDRCENPGRPPWIACRRP